MEQGLIISTPPLDVYEQMAADEYFCEAMPGKYLLRFFNWAEPGVTFGFSQRFAEVTGKMSFEDTRLPVTRRPTGGGIVFHKEDLTFSFIFFSPGEFNPYLTYEKLHTAINGEYAARGANLEILNSKTKNYSVSNPAMDCFSKPVEKDLMSGGKKVLGGALRKFSDYMLYQASFQLENAREHSEENITALTAAISKGYEVEFSSLTAGKKDLEKIGKIAYNKYRSAEWIKRI